jgi:hypothetical protein
VRYEHLAAISGQAGLAYVELTATPRLIDAVRAHANGRRVPALTDLRPYAGFAALSLIALLYGLPLFRSWSAQRSDDGPSEISTLGVAR